MIVKLLTEHNLEFLSLKGGCISSSKSTLVRNPMHWLNLQYTVTVGWNEYLALEIWIISVLFLRAVSD